MIPAKFGYRRPASLAEAVEQLGEHHGDAKVLAGGQSLIPLVKLRLASPRVLVDIGALTNFWYLYQPREGIYGLLEACCGARLTVSYVRVGGLAIDVPDDFVARCRALLESIPKFLDDVEATAGVTGAQATPKSAV